jgi:7-alpha-hydroxysteroid dehydrogenase
MQNQRVTNRSTGQFDDDFRLDGLVALITGAGRGIGAQIARTFAAAGANVVLVSRTLADLQALADQINAAGGSASVIAADVNDVSYAAQIIARAVADHGRRLDVVISNAGGAAPASFCDTTVPALDAAFHFNVSAPFELIKAATPYLLNSRNASVITITSRMDSQSSREMLIYGTVKAALTHMTRLLAAELAPSVRVNGIAPGVVETEALQAVLTPELRARITSATPLRRLASEADVANTARWLASPAASYVTGKIIPVDGGAEAPTFPHDVPDLKRACDG